MSNRQWLLRNADVPIRYQLTHDAALAGELLANNEVSAWLRRLAERSAARDLSNIHGSHDYRYENIMKKCFVLGLNREIPQFDDAARFFVDFLRRHIAEPQGDALTFGKMYAYRDYETILACYLPFVGYWDEPPVQYVVRKRLNILYQFTVQKRYDVYCRDRDLPGVKKEWRPYTIDPELYRDGNIALPSIHDYVLLAGAYRYLDKGDKDKADTIAEWLFGEGYEEVYPRFYYYVPFDPSYRSKAINGKVDLNKPDLYTCFILSHFSAVRASVWFADRLMFFDQYKTIDGRYIFPKTMIAERKDGEHMNVGESLRDRSSAEILSTYWIERILDNCREKIG